VIVTIILFMLSLPVLVWEYFSAEKTTEFVIFHYCEYFHSPWEESYEHQVGVLFASTTTHHRWLQILKAMT